jgi:hypothetical protein
MLLADESSQSVKWKKDIYIYKRIIIIMRKDLKKKEIEELYKDAYSNHLFREGFSDYRKEVEARRRKALSEEF